MSALRNILGSRWTRRACRVVGLALAVCFLILSIPFWKILPPLMRAHVAAQIASWCETSGVNLTGCTWYNLKAINFNGAIYILPTQGSFGGSDIGAQINSAISNLPICTPYPSYNYGGATNAFSGKCGRVYLPPNAPSAVGGYSLSTNVIVNTTMVRIVGTEKLNTQIQCTAATCFTFNGGNVGSGGSCNSTTPCSPNPVQSAYGGIENISLNGNGSANQIGILAIDGTSFVWSNFRVSNFNGTSAEGMELRNDNNGISERVEMDNVSFENDTSDLVFNGTGGGGFVSFNHQNLHHMQYTIGPSQTAVTFEGNAQWSGYIDGVVNVCLGGQSCTAVSILNTAQAKGFNGLLYDGAGTLTLCSGCTSSNAQFWGAGAGVSQGATNNGTLNFKDQTTTWNCTTSSATGCGLGFFASGVSKQFLFLDGSNFLGFSNGTQENFSVSNANGGGVWFNGSTSGAVNILSTAIAGGTQTIQNATGNIGVTIASGTATMTTAAIGAGACGTTVTVASANVLTTDTIITSFNAAPAGTNAGLTSWPTAGNVNFAYCPGVAENPAVATINWRVVR